MLRVSDVVSMEGGITPKKNNESKGDGINRMYDGGRDGTCRRTRNRGERYPWVAVLNPAEDRAKNHQASIQSVKNGQGERVEFSERTCWAPCCWASISFSCATIFASSSKLSARGSPTNNADVVTIQTMFPRIFPPFLKKEAVEETFDEMV